MINFQPTLLCAIFRHVTVFENELAQRVGSANYRGTQARSAGIELSVTESDMKWLEAWLPLIGAAADELELEKTIHRKEEFEKKLRFNLTLPDFHAEVRTLREAMEADLRFKYFYYYSDVKARAINSIGSDWGPVFAKLKMIETDVEAAVDCYALGHNLACVFHLMRVMEVGVQRFGKRLGVSLEHKTTGRIADKSWHQILNDLNPKLNALPQNTAKAKEKHEKFSAIQSYLYRVKDAWRNPTMHPRKTGYNDLETQNIINQVRSFLNELASVIPSRKPPKPTKARIPTPSIARWRP
jgi:hypothetical protein